MKVNYYKSVKDAWILPENIQEMEFGDWVEEATSASTELQHKEDGVLFNLCSFVEDHVSPEWDKSGDRIRRCKENIKEIYALLLDIDGSMTLTEAIGQWTEYEFFAYSTFGNSEEKEKFRFVIPLHTPLTRVEFDERVQAMEAAFNVDHASFSMSQCFFLPSYSAANKHLAWTYHNKVEQRYDALRLQKRFISQNKCPPPTPGTIDPRVGPIYEAMLTGSGLRHADALSVASLCKSIGLNLSDFNYIISKVAAPNSSLRTGDMSKLWKDAYASHMRTETINTTLKKMGCLPIVKPVDSRFMVMASKMKEKYGNLITG